MSLSRFLTSLASVTAMALLATSSPAAAQNQDSDPAVPPAMLADLEYRMVGPSRGGRVTAVAGHRSDVLTYYMGASGGGVWKTDDAGITWRPISDGYFATGSIGAITVAESNPDVVWVGTGSDGVRSNVIIGKGVYRSTDAGETWEHVGLENVGQIGALLVHPSDPDRAWVAAIGNPFGPSEDRGVYRTENGGESWDKVLFVSDSSGITDLEFAPDDPNTIYAVSWRVDRKPWSIISGGREGGVYRSTDGGANWDHITAGLPNDLRGKGDLAVSAGDPDRVYVLIEAPASEGGVYRSDDRGVTWSQVTDFQPIRNRPFYYTNLHADPQNPDILWGMAEGHWKSEDAGQTWQAQRVPHGDNHDLWINPDDPDIMIQSNDGGANVSFNGGASWSEQHNQPTAELYQVDVSDGFPYRLYAGQQDNTTISVPSFPESSRPGRPESHWEEVGGCETGPAVPKPGDPDIVYASCKGRFGVYNARTGQEQQYYVGNENIYGANPKDLMFRFQRTAPVHVSPHDPNTVYHGSQYVHRTRDGGRSWETISPDLTAMPEDKQVYSGSPITIDITGEEHYSVLYDIQESPIEPGVIWTGSNDGLVQVTRDNGHTWTDVTPEMPEFGRVQSVEVSTHKPGTAYVAVLRYMLNDFEPWGFKTEDYGQTWTRITTGQNGIPADHPLRVIRVDPDKDGLLYAGTEFGMFISFDDGLSWQSFQQNLPVTPITDLKVHEGDLVMSTMGRGFWIMDDVSRLHELPGPSSATAHLFEVEDAYRLHGGFGFGFGAPSPADPEYPRPGALIDYWLQDEPAGEVRLEIMDRSGDVVRSYSSSTPAQETVEVPTMRQFETVTLGDTPLPKTRGAHRFRWDMRHPGPWTQRPGGFGGSGPLVVPGEYSARLTVGDWSAEHAFSVVTDPRVTNEGITNGQITAQVALALEARDALSEARIWQAHLSEAIENGRTEEALQQIQEAMTTGEIRYSRPMLVDQLSYLYSNMVRADQEPGEDQADRYYQLREELDGYIEQLEQLLRRNITDLD